MCLFLFLIHNVDVFQSINGSLKKSSKWGDIRANSTGNLPKPPQRRGSLTNIFSNSLPMISTSPSNLFTRNNVNNQNDDLNDNDNSNNTVTSIPFEMSVISQGLSMNSSNHSILFRRNDSLLFQTSPVIEDDRNIQISLNASVDNDDNTNNNNIDHDILLLKSNTHSNRQSFSEIPQNGVVHSVVGIEGDIPMKVGYLGQRSQIRNNSMSFSSRDTKVRYR